MTRIALRILTALENASAAAALIAYMWMSSQPFTITNAQDQTLQKVWGAAWMAIMVAWVGGIGSISCAKFSRNPCMVRGSILSFWVFVSAMGTFVVTLALLTYSRVGAVAGPP